MINLSVLCIFVLFINVNAENHNKYSKEANTKVETPNLKNLDKPFRMNKLNILWGKAQIRLSEPKLKSLFGELKLHDKEEIVWKRIKSEGKGKDGLKEAELRTKLMRIMSMYGLLEHFEDGHIRKKDDYDGKSDIDANKSLFKDKKLNKLWSKAETAGFTSAELTALREEFNHHQDKVDQYYSILNDAKDGTDDHHENSVDEKLDRFNSLDSIDPAPKKDYLDKVNMLREQHRDIRDGFDRLHRLAAKGPNSKEFVEPKVQGLWKIAMETDFTGDELESLRVELLHYENRLLKLRHLQVEEAINEEKHNNKVKLSGKSDGLLLLQDNIKKTARKVEKMHYDLETKIMQKHIEL